MKTPDAASSHSIASAVAEVDPSTLLVGMTLLCALIAILALGCCAIGAVRGIRARRRLRRLSQDLPTAGLRATWWLEGGIATLALILPALTVTWVRLCRLAAVEAHQGGFEAALLLASEQQLQALITGASNVLVSLPFLGVALALALAGRSQIQGLTQALDQVHGGARPDAPHVRALVRCPGLRGYQPLVVVLSLTQLVLTPLLLGAVIWSGDLQALVTAVGQEHPTRAGALLQAGLDQHRPLLDAFAAASLLGLMIAAAAAVLMFVVLSPARRRAKMAVSS